MVRFDCWIMLLTITFAFEFQTLKLSLINDIPCGCALKYRKSHKQILNKREIKKLAQETKKKNFF